MMQQLPNEAPFNEPPGQAPLEPGRFREPCPSETPPCMPDRQATPRPPECPPDPSR